MTTGFSTQIVPLSNEISSTSRLMPTSMKGFGTFKEVLHVIVNDLVAEQFAPIPKGYGIDMLTHLSLQLGIASDAAAATTAAACALIVHKTRIICSK